MKSFNKIFYFALLSMFTLLISSCEEVITEFGNNSSISGFIKDASGNIVPGDITTTNLSVKALGEGDVVSTDMRVNGEGVFSHKRLYPKKYKIFVTGPVTPVGDTIHVDFSVDKNVVRDIIVIPFLTVKKPAVVGSPTTSSVVVDYEITPNSGKTVTARQLYCSTNPYPNSSTGSGPFYTTKTVTLNTNSGNASITGLTSKTTYYIRIGARATGATGFNYSDQVVITTE